MIHRLLEEVTEKDSKKYAIDTNHPSQGEHGVVLEQGLAEDAQKGDHPGHQEPGDGDQDEHEGDGGGG